MRSSFAIYSKLLGFALLLDTLVRDEEKRCSRRRAHYRGANAIVDSSKSARCPEAGRRLEASLERVERVKRNVDCGACYSACLRSSASCFLCEVSQLAYKERS